MYNGMPPLSQSDHTKGWFVRQQDKLHVFCCPFFRTLRQAMGGSDLAQGREATQQRFTWGRRECGASPYPLVWRQSRGYVTSGWVFIPGNTHFGHQDITKHPFRGPPDVTEHPSGELPEDTTEHTSRGPTGGQN